MNNRATYLKLILTYLLDDEADPTELTPLATDPIAQTVLAELTEALAWEDDPTWLEQLAAADEGTLTPEIADLLAHRELLQARLPQLVAQMEALQGLLPNEPLDLRPDFPTFAEQFKPRRRRRWLPLLPWFGQATKDSASRQLVWRWGPVAAGLATLATLLLCFFCSPVTAWLVRPYLSGQPQPIAGETKRPIPTLAPLTATPSATVSRPQPSATPPPATPTPAPVAVVTLSPTATPLPSPTPRPVVPTPGLTPPTVSPTATPRLVLQVTPTFTPLPLPSPSPTIEPPTATPLPSPTPRPTNKPQPTSKPSKPNTPIIPTVGPPPTTRPTSTPQPTTLPTVPTATSEPTSQPTPTAAPTATSEPTSQPTPTAAPTTTNEPTSQPTPTTEPTSPASPTPIIEPTLQPTPPPPSASPTPSPTGTPTPSGLVVNPIVQGTIREWPLTGQREILSSTIEAAYHPGTTGTNGECDIRRGIVEFDIPAMNPPVAFAQLVVTQLEPLPSPVDFDLLTYLAADLTLQLDDFDQPATHLATLPQQPLFILEVTDLISSPTSLGFRLQLTDEPPCVEADSRGTTFNIELIMVN